MTISTIKMMNMTMAINYKGDTCDDNYELVTIRQEIISHCVVSVEGRKVVTNGQLTSLGIRM